MKSTQLVFAVVTTFALTLGAIAQTENLQSSDALSSNVAKARCAYTPADDACAADNDSHPAADAPGSRLLAQLPRRMPGHYPAPRRRPIAYPYPAYPAAPTVSGRHIAIGAAIGFTLGVVAGSHSGARDALCVGTVAAGIGAFMGLLVPAFPPRHYYPGPSDDNDASRKNPNRQESGTARAAAGRPDQHPLQDFEEDRTLEAHNGRL